MCPTFPIPPRATDQLDTWLEVEPEVEGEGEGFEDLVPHESESGEDALDVGPVEADWEDDPRRGALSDRVADESWSQEWEGPDEWIPVAGSQESVGETRHDDLLFEVESMLDPERELDEPGLELMEPTEPAESSMSEFDGIGLEETVEAELGLSDEQEGVVDTVTDMVERGLVSAAVLVAIAAGERDERKLTNRIYFARHRELGGRKLRPDETEWLQIRDGIVRPLLARRQADPSGATGARQRMSTQALREAWARGIRPDAVGQIQLVDAEATDEQREQMQPYLPEGGQGYSEKERRYAAEHPSGLIRTATVIGKNEKLLSKQGPWWIRLGRELSSFEGGRLGQFADTYNGFAIYMNELLAGLGRVQDLEKAGAPVLPDEMTHLQKQAMRRTDDTKAQEKRKSAFEAWTKSRADYRQAVSETVTASDEVSDARRKYWVAKAELDAHVLEMKRLAKTRADLKSLEDFELSLKDLVGLATGGKTGPVMLALDFRERRKAWDSKVADFQQKAKQAKLANFAVLTKFEMVVKSVYDAEYKRDAVVDRRGEARLTSRRLAALFGQSSSSAPAARMPPLMGDAYYAIAAVGPEAAKELRRAHRYNPTLMSALRRYQPERIAADASRKDPNRPPFFHDITQVRDAAVYLQKWQVQLLDLIVDDALSIHKRWDAFFKDLYR